MCRVRRRRATSAWPLADGALFAPGATIATAAGYGDTEQPIFEGSATRLGMRIEGENKTCLVVDCCHEAAKMTALRNNAHYIDQTDSALIGGLAQAHGLLVIADEDRLREQAPRPRQC